MDTSVLNVVVGLVLIFLLYSLLATALQEALAAIFQRRANTLYKGIKTMLTNTEPQRGMLVEFIIFLIELYARLFYSVVHWFLDKDEEKHTLHEKFYDHPIIKNYSENIVFNKPSYLTSENFSTILIETVKNLDIKNRYATASFKMIRDTVDNYSYSPAKSKATSNTPIIEHETYKILNYHLNEAAGDLDVFKFRIEKWYNDTMDRVSGWYKRSTQLWLFILGILLGIAFNLDTIEITNYLSRNKEAAEKLADMGVAMASRYNDPNAVKLTEEIADTLKTNINKVNSIVGLGWGDYGETDPEFKKLILANREYKNMYEDRLNGAIKRYNSEFNSLKSMYDSIKLNIILKYKIEKQLLDLQINKGAIISQYQFSQLYDKDDSTLERKYIWYNLKTHPKKWLGFFLTAIAISLGAPFWFDLLNKFVSLRTAVKTVDSSGSTTKNNKVDNSQIDG